VRSMGDLLADATDTLSGPDIATASSRLSRGSLAVLQVFLSQI
jgi:hypothetical protein